MGFWDVIKFWDEKRQRRTEVHVRVHEAVLLTDPNQPLCYFINVWNASPERAATVTHTWFATEPPVNFVNPARPLPVRIEPRDQWETWLQVGAVPARPPDIYNLARVQLADDSVISSVERRNVPPAGTVPGT